MKIKIAKPVFLFFTICILFLTYSCKRQQFEISGHFDNCNSMYVMLDEIKPDNIEIIDTILIINGNFRYKFKVEQESIYRLRLSDTNLLPLIGGKKDKLSIRADAGDLSGTYKIEGNDASMILWDVNRQIGKMYRLTDSLSKIFKEYQARDSLSYILPFIDSCYYTNFLACKSYLKSVIENNKGNIAVIPVFYQKIGTKRFFSEGQDSLLFNDMLKNLQKTHPDNPHVKEISEKFI